LAAANGQRLKPPAVGLVVIPQAARAALGLEAGDELLVLCKSDRVVMMPKPKKFARRTAGLHREVWQGAGAYLKDERDSW
jgi:AbrB family looped-hinge helix DNA binding protein